MAEQPNWRIYYDDESTFDSSMGEPMNTPGFGFICIVQPDELVGRMIMWGWDRYYWVPADAQWWGSDDRSIGIRQARRLETVAPSYGANVSNTLFRKIMAAADHDPDFPPKSGKIRGEHP